MSESLTTSAKALLVASMLAKDGLISNNGKGFLKELILRKDPRIDAAMELFEGKGTNQEASVIDELTKLIDGEAYALYSELFRNCSLEDGKSLSKKEREDGDLSGKSLIYGEVDFFSFAAILRKINPDPGAVFYDLGSGTGKAIFVARFTCDFLRCTGVEILEGLSDAAAAVNDKFNNMFREFLCAAQPQEVTVHQGSFLDFDWSDGDVIFANSTCFDEDLMEKTAAQAADLQPGAYVITFTKGLDSPAFEIIFKKRYDMSWGPATVWIHRRLRHDGTSVSHADGHVVGMEAEEEDGGYEDEDEDGEDDNDDDVAGDDEDDEDEGAAGLAEHEGSSARTMSGLGTGPAGRADAKESSYTFREPPLVKRAAHLHAPTHLSSPQDTALMRRKRVHT